MVFFLKRLADAWERKRRKLFIQMRVLNLVAATSQMPVEEQSPSRKFEIMASPSFLLKQKTDRQASKQAKRLSYLLPFAKATLQTAKSGNLAKSLGATK